ncbi:MAG: protocatechuate 4,5-dioxygenase subunit alpha [Pseudomonadota bacterium]
MPKPKPTAVKNDIPGTFVFTAEHSRVGYDLNMFCMSLSKAGNRERFQAGEEAYLDDYDLTPGQRSAILERDWNGMLEQGGNVYYTLKLAACDGVPYEEAYALMAGMPREDYRAMMLTGGRPVEGNRYLSDWEDR